MYVYICIHTYIHTYILWGRAYYDHVTFILYSIFFFWPCADTTAPRGFLCSNRRAWAWLEGGLAPVRMAQQVCVCGYVYG